MSKKDIYQHLDDPNQPISDPESLELLSLLQEVKELPDPNPGDAYWQHFNARLNRRLSQTIAADSIPWWKKFRIPLGMALAVSALLLFLLINPAKPFSKLEKLDDAQLQLMALIYSPLEQEEQGIHPAYSSGTDLLNALEDALEQDLLLDPESLQDLETLKDTWNLDG